MAIKYTKTYTNEAEYMLDLAKSSDLYRADTFTSLMSSKQEEDYAYALAGTKIKNSDSFDIIDYDLLSGEDRYLYLINEYYVDKNEMAKDEETGEQYNVYDRNKEYLDYKIEKASDLQTYKSLSGFEKFLHTTGGVLGNALNEVTLGFTEGVIDALALIIGGLGFEAIEGADFKGFIAKDITGAQAVRESLQKHASAYTHLDKSKFWKITNDVFTGYVKMLPMFIPYVGQVLYFGAMAGNTAEAAVRANPDIHYAALYGYTAGVTGLEYGIEKFSGKVFNTKALIGGSKSGSYLARVGMDMLSEGFEESVAEFSDSILYKVMVDENAPIASFKDIMYAGLIGGLIGGIATTGRVATTRNQIVTSDGTVMDAKTAKELGISGEKLSKTKSLTVTERLQDVQNLSRTDALTDLQAKYSKETLQEIEQNHKAEYQRAVEQNQKNQEELTQVTLALAKVLETIGVENFSKAVDLANYSIEQQADLAKKYVSKITGTSAQNRLVEAKFKALAGEQSSFTVVDSLTATQQKIKDAIKKEYGIDVYYGNIGEQDGIFRRHGLTLDENTIVLDVADTQNMSVDTIMEKVVKEELVHALQYQSGIITAKTLNDLMEQFEMLGGVSKSVRLDEAYKASADITKITESQAKSMSQVLLFDKISVSRIFLTNTSTFNKVYRWMLKLKESIENLKNRKTNKDKVKYRHLLKSMAMYRDVVAEHIGNEEDANIAAKEMMLSDEELAKLTETYLPDYTNEHYTLLKAEYTIHSEQRMAAERLLSEARADINKLLPFSYKYVFNPEYYGTIKTREGEEVSFVDYIMSADPSRDFRTNLQDYMINVMGFAINAREGCLMEVVDYNKVTTNDFDKTVASLQTDPEALNKYTRLSQIFSENFNSKFITTEGINQLEEIDLRIVSRETESPIRAYYERMNAETQRPTIVVYMKAGQTLSLSQIDNLKHDLFHETTHALADIQGLQNGTSTNYVRSALMQSADRATINKLGKLLLTEEFFNANKNNTQTLIDNIAYGIYRITDGEYAAEAYASSITRKDDIKLNLKAGATMNRSGFRTDGLMLYGYGKFSGIELQATTIVRAKQQYRLSALKKATEVVAYSKTSELSNFLTEKGIVDMEKAGFSYEFVDALENETLTNKDLLDMFNRDEIGSSEATNVIIEWLTRNNPNKNVKTIEDINKIKKDGLINAMTYNKIRQKNDAQYNKNESHTYEEVKDFIDKNPNAKITVKTKDGTDEISAVMYKFKQLNKIEDYLTVENSKANQIILKSDFDYSINSTKQLLKDLRNNKISQEFMEIDTEESDETSDDDERVFSSLDKLSYEQYEDVVDTGEMDGIIEKESTESKLTRIANEAKKNLSEWLTTSGRSGKAYEIKNTLLEYAQNIKESDSEISFNDVVSLEDFENIIGSVITEENWRTIRKKLENNKEFIDTLFGKGTSLSLRQDISKQFQKIESERQQKIDTVVKKQIQKKPKSKQEISSVIKPSESTMSVEETVPEQKAGIEEISTVKETQPVQTETDKILERETLTAEEKQKAAEQKVSDDKLEITQEISDKKEKLKGLMVESKASMYQGDTTTKEYIAAETETINKNLEFFESITSEELQPLLQSLAVEISDEYSAAGRTLLSRYAYNNRYSQFKDIAEFIKEYNRIQTSTAGSTLGGMGQIYGKGHVKAFVSDLAIRNKTEISLPPSLVLKALDNKYGTLEDYFTSVQNELKNLEEQYKQTKDAYDKYVIKEKMKELSRILDALDDSDIAGTLDAIMAQLENKEEFQNENLEKIAEISSSIVEFMLTQSDISLNITGGQKISAVSPKVKEKLMNFWAGLNTFRYLAMLSSPKTAAKNATSNTLVVTKAIIDDVITGKFEKSNILYQESQVKFTGSYDTEFSKYIDDNYKEYVKKEVSGDRYYGSEMNKLKAEYAKSKNPLLKRRGFAYWQALEQKMLQDTPWTMRRSLRNIKNMLAGSAPLMLLECEEWLSAKYGKGKNITKNEITQAQLINNIRETNSELADLYESAINGNLTSVLRLSEKLNISLLDQENPKSIINVAIYRGNELLFKVDNWYTTLRKQLNKSHPAAVAVLDGILPFMRTTVNTTAYMINHSPIGIVKGVIKLLQTKQMYISDIKDILNNYYKQQFNTFKHSENSKYKFKQEEYEAWFESKVPTQVQTALNNNNYKELSKIYDSFVEDGKIARGLVGRTDPYSRAMAFERLSQGLSGTAVMALGAILAAVTNAFDYDDDDDYLGPVINIGDVKIAMSDLAPFTTMFTVGAMLTSSDNWSENISRAFKVFADESLFSVMDSAIAYSTDVWDFAGNQATNIAQSFIPSFLKNIAKIADNAKKDKSGNWGMNFLKTTASNIPGLSYVVPNKINPYTGEKEKYYEGGIFESLINQVFPISFRIDNKSELEKLANSLDANTTGISGRYTINDKKYNVTDKEKENISKFRAKLLEKEYNAIVKGTKKVTVEGKNGKRITTTWNKLTKEQKSSVLKGLYTKTSEITKIKWWTSKGNQYVVTDRNKFNTYRDALGTTQGLIYKQSWSKSKFIER